MRLRVGGLKNIFPDKTISRAMLRGGTAAAALRAVSTGGQLAFNILLGRFYGASGAGIFYLAFSSVAIAATFGRLGLDTAVLRYAAIATDGDDPESATALYRLAIKLCLISTALITLLLIVIAAPLADTVFHDPKVVTPLRVLALGTTPLAIGAITGEFLKGIGRPAIGVIVETTAAPIFAVIALTISRVFSSGIVSVCAAYSAALTVVMIYGAVEVWQASPRQAWRHTHFDRKLLLRTSCPLFAVAISSLVMTWTPILILGALASERIVGIFAIVLRCAQFIAWPLTAANAVVAPRLASLFARHDSQAVGRLVRASTLLTATIALPTWFLMTAGSTLVLDVFGRPFAPGRWALVVVSTGQLLNVCLGPVGYLLTMSGNQSTARTIQVTVAIIGTGLTYILTREYGLGGAALATAVSVVAWNVWSAGMAHRKTGVSLFTWSGSTNRTSEDNSLGGAQ